jgi:small subunit ribosomal protein S15
MSLTATETAQVVKTHQRATGDTGSSEVQIALLTARIEKLTEHLKSNIHDYHTRYGLTRMVSQRRRLMRYFKRVNPEGYRKLVETLEVRG